jgi:hypothetical protein
MSATDQRVGERLAKGMNITEATREGDAESNRMVDRDEDYNTRYGGWAGYQLAFKRTKLIPRNPIALDLVAMVREAEANTPETVVDHFVRRFMRVSIAGKDRQVLVDFLKSRRMDEDSLRELLYVVLSMPEYQLG